jgi:hypothetical protein
MSSVVVLYLRLAKFWVTTYDISGFEVKFNMDGYALPSSFVRLYSVNDLVN